MAEIVPSLFGIDPNTLQQQRLAQAQEQARLFAQMSPNEQVSYGGYMAGSQFGNALGGLMGAKDPELQRITDIRTASEGEDTTTAEGLANVAKKLAAMGRNNEAMQVMAKSQELAKSSLEKGKTEAEIQLAKARAAAAGQAKQSTADIAARRALITKVEQRLANGEVIADNDPDLIQARAALAIETKPQSLRQEDGSYIQLPGIDAATISPLLGRRIAGGVLPTVPTASPVPGRGLDMSRVTPEQLKTLMQDDPTGQALAAGIARFNAQQPSAMPTSAPTIIQTPTSVAKAEQAQGAIKNRIENLQYTLDSVAKARSLISPFSTGWGAALLSSLPETDAMALADAVSTLKSESVLGTLAQLKEASKTGASGLGQVTEKELPLLENRIRSLNPKSKTFPQDLAYVERVWRQIQSELQNKTQPGTKPATNREAKIDQYMQTYPGYSRAQIEAFLKQNKVID